MEVYMFSTYIRPIIHAGERINRTVLMTLLCMMLFVGVSMLIGVVLTKVMKEKGYVTSIPITLILTAVVSLFLYGRFGLSVTAIQGVFLMFVLLYASCSDLTNHIVDDYVWVIVFALALLNIQTVGLTSMVMGAFCVFIPQMAMALLPPHKTLGGADIKLSTALAFLLGWQRGLAAYIVGLLLAIIVMCIVNKIRKNKESKAFALVPFLSVAAMAMFMF